ncbi:hypothetical protein DH86_00001748, partial [Scytalidium sp. 3C]
PRSLLAAKRKTPYPLTASHFSLSPAACAPANPPPSSTPYFRIFTSPKILAIMSQSSYSSAGSSWQERLEGGRTAWSSTVTVQGQSISARYWYDGQYVNNAKEDAAELALKHLNSSAPSSPAQSRNGW